MIPIDRKVKFPCKAPDLEILLQELFIIRNDILTLGENISKYPNIHPRHKKSAINLLQYLAFRLHDIRPVQYKLTSWGLSSLGRTERKVQATIDTVIAIIHELLELTWHPQIKPPFCFEQGRQRLIDNTIALFGETPEARRARIMVTMPTEASTDIQLIQDLMHKGMNIARINCAHDDAEIWGKIIENIKTVESSCGKSCKIHMDLGGPKLRTSEIVPGSSIIKIKPERNEYGIVTNPAQIELQSQEKFDGNEGGGAYSLPVNAEFLTKLEIGDSLLFKDARDSKRKMKVVHLTASSAIVELHKTAYFKPGLKLKLKRSGAQIKKINAWIGILPARENYLLLAEGDLLIVDKKLSIGKPAKFDNQNQLIAPAIIGCSIPSVLDDVQLGEPIWFDDGKLGGIINSIDSERIEVLIQYAQNGTVKLKKEKGINLPDTSLHLSAISNQDEADMAFVMENADSIGLSFANDPEDVFQLIEEMKKYKEELPGIILKIETARGFNQLPDMLLAAMTVSKFGVMIARGDLAIECGFGRLAELQEEILWICEAAHVPVIWATQVLEGLSKRGEKTRSEYTDAAMGQRAECIMLNKGDHIVMATQTLDDILRRMQDHQTKKRSTHRKLQLAEQFFERIHTERKDVKNDFMQLGH